MSITPQAIKDQEFQVKFRGYDAIEVKAYLELLAEEFFELHEQIRKQIEDFETLSSEKEVLASELANLQQEIKRHKDLLDNSQTEIARKNDEVQTMQKAMQELQTLAEGSRKEAELAREVVDAVEKKMKIEQEKASTKLAEELDAAEARINEHKEKAQQLGIENEKLRHQLQMVEQQNKELKKGEMDFKSTIVAAQKFSDDLRQRSENEARDMMARAKQDVESFRRKAQEELARLPLEIENLHKKRVEIREELRRQLHDYLDALDTFSESQDPEQDRDLMDLFQSIQIPDVEGLETDDLDQVNLKLV
ncbi:MAG: DivIVA domain-containing protein [Desulfobulbaceae bacterium]|nr:MAG: DivIVA domain-containing protein [Desulfobulbaceae bacterium]